MLATGQADSLIEELTKPLMRELSAMRKSSEAPAAGSGKLKKEKTPILNVRESNRFVTLTQKLTREEAAEQSNATKLIESLQLPGAIVIADAWDHYEAVALDTVSNGADYIFAIKPVNTELFVRVAELFGKNSKPMICSAPRTDNGSEVIETNSVRVLPGSKLPPSLTEGCIGLEEGCLIEAKKELENTKKDDRSVIRRYFFSSIPFESADKDAQQALLEKLNFHIAQHWSTENKDLWILDIVFRKDRIKWMNAEYLKGRVFLERLALRFLERFQETLGRP